MTTRVLLWSFLHFFLLLATAGSCVKGQGLDQFKNDVVEVQVGRGANRATENGTGFVVSAEGGTVSIVTARHLFFDGRDRFTDDISVTFYVDKLRSYPASLLTDSSKLDVAVLKVENLPLSLAQQLPRFSVRADSRPLAIPEALHVFGGQSQGWQVSTVTVSDTGDDDSTEGFRFNGNGIRAGFSGAPIVDDQGRLVGAHLGAADNDGIYGRAMRMTKASEVLIGRKGLPPMNLLNFAALPNADAVSAAGYLEKAFAEPGAVKTASGLIYREIAPGAGTSPLATDRVKVKYRATIPNGKVIAESENEFRLDQVLKCWTEGVQKMKTGGKAHIVCPADLAYGEQGAGGVPGGSPLVLDVELLSVVLVTGLSPSNGDELKGGGNRTNPLVRAISDGNPGMARTLLSNGADPNLGSPLTVAVEVGDAETVRALFDHGAKIELAAHPKDSGGLQIEIGVALLYSAVVRNHAEVAKVLFEHGLNPNSAVPRYGNLLTVAGWRSNAEMVEVLLSKGARVDEVGDHANGTALHGAVSRGDLRMTKALVAEGSSLRALSRPQISETPLGLAYIHLTDEGGERRAVFNFLLSSERTRPEDRMHARGLVLEDGNIKIAQQILAMEIAPSRDKGEQPLNGAIRLGDAVLVERLVKMGVDVNAPDRRGVKPLLVITRTHNLLVASKCRIFKLLIDRGATLSNPKAEDDVKELQAICSQAQ